jgi:hypothetical protein
VAQQLLEFYGPDEMSLMDADVTDERDWEGAPELRGLSEGKIVEITRLIYDQDRDASPTNSLYADRSPPLALRSCGRRCRHMPGTAGKKHDDKWFIKPPPPPDYDNMIDNGETAEADPPQPSLGIPYEGFLPASRTWRYAKFRSQALYRLPKKTQDALDEWNDDFKAEDNFESEGEDEPLRSELEAEWYVCYLEACRVQEIDSIPFDSWMQQGRPEPADAKDMDPSVEYLPLV